MKRPFIVFAAVLAIAALLAMVLPLGGPVFWSIALAAAAVLSLASRAPAVGGFLPRSEFLCDTCKYNDARDCSRPERPNATRCPDYRSR
jgi:hypothetical protein